ncbi:MAG: hypothetical protein O9293_05980 [Porphyrobacter sp.]|nr:hypothetical protein [Porphyrobacter sp.]
MPAGEGAQLGALLPQMIVVSELMSQSWSVPAHLHRPLGTDHGAAEHLRAADFAEVAVRDVAAVRDEAQERQLVTNAEVLTICYALACCHHRVAA